jgi:hypothetical protein
LNLIQLINENNEQLGRKLFVGIGSILNDATEFIFPKSITGADSFFLFVTLLNSGNLQVQFRAIKNLFLRASYNVTF